MNYEKEFLKVFNSICHRHQRARVFEDWVTMTSSALIVKSSPQHAEESEAEYMALVPRYTRDELNEFSHMLAITTLALEKRPCDFLGAVFMQAEISNGRLGQFFTPYELSYLIAKMTIHDIDPEKDLVTVQEPACGSGGMVIAFCEAARDVGINFQWQTYTVAVDVSEVAARMAYIQLSLLGIPAHVVWGNTLSMEFRRQWPTMGFWTIAHKVAKWKREQCQQPEAPPTTPEATISPLSQPAPICTEYLTQAAFNF